jgi:hypothetical protein
MKGLKKPFPPSEPKEKSIKNWNYTCDYLNFGKLLKDFNSQTSIDIDPIKFILGCEVSVPTPFDKEDAYFLISYIYEEINHNYATELLEYKEKLKLYKEKLNLYNIERNKRKEKRKIKLLQSKLESTEK